MEKTKKDCGCTSPKLLYDGAMGFEQKWTMCIEHAEAYRLGLDPNKNHA